MPRADMTVDELVCVCMCNVVCLYGICDMAWIKCELQRKGLPYKKKKAWFLTDARVACQLQIYNILIKFYFSHFVEPW